MKGIINALILVGMLKGALIMTCIFIIGLWLEDYIERKKGNDKK
jgi:hypothetical protein